MVARKNDLGENSLVAYIVPARQAAILQKEVVRFLAGKLPEYMVPSSLVILEKLPLTPNGKLDRRALPAPGSADSRAGAESLEGPRDAVETQLVKIWESVLGTNPIGIRQTFLSWGATHC